MSLKHAILSMLTDQPKTGYDIAKEFSYSVKNYWHASHQQIYKTLAEIEEKHWVSCLFVEQSSKPSKKEYLITESGKEELVRWVVKPLKHETYKSTLSIKIISMGAVGTGPILLELHEYKDYIHKQVVYLEDIENTHYPNAPEEVKLDSDYNRGRYFVLRRAWHWCQQELNWLDETIAFLETRDTEKKK